MIRLAEAELASVWPPYIKQDADAAAISYAFRMAMGKLLSFAQVSTLYGNVDGLPEELLDLLALELRSQYYDEGMDIATKRGIIRNTAAWYAKGGTVSAVNEMIQTVFGDGNVIEWPDFGGEPGTFLIETDTEMSPDNIARFNDVIRKVKNASSTLVGTRLSWDTPQQIYMLSQCRNNKHIVVLAEED